MKNLMLVSLEGLNSLTDLRVLNLNNNRLTSLSFEGLVNLEVLNLESCSGTIYSPGRSSSSANSLRVLESALQSCHSLTKLRLDCLFHDNQEAIQLVQRNYRLQEISSASFCSHHDVRDSLQQLTTRNRVSVVLFKNNNDKLMFKCRSCCGEMHVELCLMFVWRFHRCKYLRMLFWRSSIGSRTLKSALIM